MPEKFSNTNSRTVDFLVTAIDNFGDVGFALDLGESLLFLRPKWKIRFFCDNREVFDRLTDKRPHPRIAYWNLSEYENANPSKTVVSFFDRKLPKIPFFTQAGNRKILQLSYLRFDSGITSLNGTRYRIEGGEVVHLVPSPIVGGAGIVIPRFLGKRSEVFQDWNKAMRYSENSASPFDWTPSVSVFCYPETLTRIEAIQKYATGVRFVEFGNESQDVSLPFLRFDEYGAILPFFAANIVRGENSAIKAMLAGKPFLWDFYKEKNGAHVEKIEDFLTFVRPFFENGKDFETYTQATKAFNAIEFSRADARRCAEVLATPSEGLIRAFEKLSETIVWRDIGKTLLREIEA